MPRPAVSIGLLTHNYGRYIRTALDSVLAQTFTNWELLVSDDCSTDDTAAVVAPYLADRRIRYLRHASNLRQGGNWAYAIEHGTADRIATLHADDWWPNDALSIATAQFDADSDLDLLSGWYEYVEADGRPSLGVYRVLSPGDGRARAGGSAAYAAEAAVFSCLPSASIFRRRTLDTAGLPRTDLDMLVDWEFFLRIAAASCKVIRVPQTLAMYRRHGAGTTSVTAADGRLLAELRRMHQIARETHPVIPGCLQAIGRRVARELYSTGLGRYLAGQRLAGRRLIREAARHDLGILASPKYVADLFLTTAGPLAMPLVDRIHSNRRTQ